MLNITNHQGNANKNEIPSHPKLEWLLSKRQKVTNAGEDVKNSHTVGEI
jgi:hypothetical protein